MLDRLHDVLTTMKKIELKKLRSLAIGTLVVSPALITIAYAKTCDECTDDWRICVANVDYSQGLCHQACDNAPDPFACRAVCDAQQVVGSDNCLEELLSCSADCTC